MEGNENEMCRIEVFGRRYIGTYHDCCEVVGEVYEKTGIVLGIARLTDEA